MHLRILPPRQRHRQSFVNPAVRRAQLRLDEMAQRVDLGADLRVAIEPVDGGQRQQHEGVVVGIAQRIQHRAIRLQRVDEAGFAVGGFRLGSEDAPAPSARSRGRRDTSPSAPPWRSNRSGAPARKPGAAPRRSARPSAIEPIDKAARFVVPAFGRPQRQAVVDHAKLQPRDDIGRIQRICRRSGISFSHCVPWNIPTPVAAV